MTPLSQFPNLLMNLEDLEDPYLLEPIDLEPQTLMKCESELLSSMLFTDVSDATEKDL